MILRLLFRVVPLMLVAVAGGALAQPSTVVPNAKAKPAAVAPVPAAPAVVEVSLRDPVRLQSAPGPNPLWNVVLTAGAALFGAAIGSWSSSRNAQKAIIQKTNEIELQSIERRLTEFVGPFMQLSEENRILAVELKRNQPQGADFRTLTGLLTRGWLRKQSKGDQNLVTALVVNGIALRALISEKGASAAPPEFLPYFSKASAHFRFLELAAAGSLDMTPDRYGEYVYPRQLDGVMSTLQLALQARRQALLANPDKPLPPMGSLDIPPLA